MNMLGASGGDVISTVEISMRRLLGILLKDGIKKDAGYFTLRSSVYGEIILIARIGFVPHDKYEKYMNLSQEKGARLFANILTHKSSWQSRDGDKLLGGAIVANGLILSFSGLPELADEALMLDAAVGLGWLTPKEASEIAAISSNTYYTRLNG